jgi:hypothetical protein
MCTENHYCQGNARLHGAFICKIVVRSSIDRMLSCNMHVDYLTQKRPTERPPMAEENVRARA